MGTPTEDTWPGVTSLPDFKSSFPKWPSKVINLGLLLFFRETFMIIKSNRFSTLQELATVVPTLDSPGLDLLGVSYIFL